MLWIVPAFTGFTTRTSASPITRAPTTPPTQPFQIANASTDAAGQVSGRVEAPSPIRTGSSTTRVAITAANDTAMSASTSGVGRVAVELVARGVRDDGVDEGRDPEDVDTTPERGDQPEPVRVSSRRGRHRSPRRQPARRPRTCL